MVKTDTLHSFFFIGAPTGTAFEERQALLFEMQGKQGQLQDKYDALRRKQLECEDERSTLEEKLEKVKQDMAQSDYEQKEFDIELDGMYIYCFQL